MSDRSAAWYAVPGNAERRKRRMRAYGAALVELANRYPAERRREYDAARQRGESFTNAQASAMRAVRDAHKDEFDQIYREKRA